MQNQYASSTLTVNLAAITANYRLLKENCGNNCTVSAVVKANAYGLGVREVAAAIEKEGCNTFFVANLDEALELRNILPRPRIFVLHGIIEGQEEFFINYGIVPVLNSIHQVNLWKKVAASKQKRLPCALHFDTGMNRLGIKFSDYKRQDEEPLHEYLEIKYIMSHLACADDNSHNMNKEQLKELRNIAKLYKDFKVSIANSAGIFLGKDYHLDMVRPGLALYGANPTTYAQNPMNNVVRLASKILQIETVGKSGSVGYGASYNVKAGTKIATIAAGYADGYLRSLSNVGICSVGGVTVPVIGRVSMDLVTIDVTGVPAEQLTIGTEIELIGDNIPVDVVAGKAGTISYEILTSLGSRYKRKYI